MMECLGGHRLPRETGRMDRKEGGFLCRGRWGGWTGMRGAKGRGHFYNGMPGWTYFSRATPGHLASNQ